MSSSETRAALTRQQVLDISNEDASKVYRDLSKFEIRATLDVDGWHVDYDLRDPELEGGGPHYTIDRYTGRIITKRYEQ